MESPTKSWDSPRRQVLDSIRKTRPLSRQMCLTCKGGRLLCGHDSCPILSKIDLRSPVEDRLKQDMFGPSASVFIGWKGYPTVYAGPMTSLDDERAEVLDNPGAWYGMGFDDIVRARSLLVRGKQKHQIKEDSRFTDEMQEIALSVRPVDVETHYVRAPKFSMTFSPLNQPMGASGEIESIHVADNPLIPSKVDYVISDDLRATEQVSALFERNFDVYYLTNVFASGALGLDDAKRMVPTRWSITAVDDILGKELMKRVRDHPTINEYQVWENTYLGNHFEVLAIPGAWEFEQFEAWSPNTLWTQDADEFSIVEEHEPHEGRWDYAINEGGGYYAGRFATAEAMERMRRQARCIIFREIYDTYLMPVGVWEVRENVRKAMEKKPKKFTNLKAALDDCGSRLMINIDRYVEKSQILRQRRITDYT